MVQGISLIGEKKYLCRLEMRPRSRQSIAWVLLLAFCGMTVTKAFHHHHWEAVEDIVCPIDGIALSHHTLAHTVLQSLEDDGEGYCAICHFTVNKVVFPHGLHFFCPNQKLSTLLFVSTPFAQSNLQGVSLLRAPPVQLGIRN